MILDILFHVIIWVAIIVIAHLVLRKVLRDGWRSLYKDPLRRITPPRSTRNDPSLWDHLEDED